MYITRIVCMVFMLCNAVVSSLVCRCASIDDSLLEVHFVHLVVLCCVGYAGMFALYYVNVANRKLPVLLLGYSIHVMHVCIQHGLHCYA